jgi:hypothetical protein
MKKISIILLCAIFAITISSCGSSNSSNKELVQEVEVDADSEIPEEAEIIEEPSKWEIIDALDEFGDPWGKLLTQEFTGTYSRFGGDSISGTIDYVDFGDTTGKAVVFTLYIYGDSPVSSINQTNPNVIIKAKAGDGTKYDFEGFMNTNESGFTYIEEKTHAESYNGIMKVLLDGGEVEIIIQDREPDDNINYSFSIDANGFKDKLQEYNSLTSSPSDSDK